MKISQKFLNAFFSGLMDHPSMSTPGGGKDTNKGFKEEGGGGWESLLKLEL
jgi:hypothetical protein